MLMELLSLRRGLKLRGRERYMCFFPEVEVKGIKAKELFEICGLVDVGGDAIKDSEDVYNE
jgi:hypothetical protein